MSETKNILKTALDNLNKQPETDKSVAPGAQSNKPDVSNPDGSVSGTEKPTNTTGTAESEKSTGASEDDAQKATKPNQDKEFQDGMKDDDKLDNSGHSDANDADDDDVEDSVNSKIFNNFCKSLDSNSETIKSLKDTFDSTMKSLPSILADALAKSIDESVTNAVTKAVIKERNKTDLTQSEKDVDGSQDQSQKNAGEDDGDDEEVEESVASGHNTTDLTRSEKSAKNNIDKVESSKNKANAQGVPTATNKSADSSNTDAHEDTQKSLEGTSKAVQEAAPADIDDTQKETVNKSVNVAPAENKPLTPDDIVNKSLDIENQIANKKFNTDHNDIEKWNKLDSVYRMAKSARQNLDENTLNEAITAFNNLK